MVKKDKKVNETSDIKDVKKTKTLKKTRTSEKLELYDLETGNADLEYTRKFDSNFDTSVKKSKSGASNSKTLTSKRKSNTRKTKFSTNDIKAFICGIFYLIAFVLLIVGVIKYANHDNMRECSKYFIIVLFLVVVATMLVSIEISNKNVKTLLGFSITNKVSKKRRVKEYFKESVLISLIATTFIAIYIATGDLFIDFYKLTSNVALNVVLVFIFMYIVILLLSYILCYLYSENKIGKK